MIIMTNFVLLFILIGNSVLVFSTVEISERLLLKQGDEATLWCDSDTGDTSFPKSWIKWSAEGFKKIIAKKSFVERDEVRLTISTFILFKSSWHRRVHRYSLVIKNVTLGDTGTYECQFELENGTVVYNNTFLLVFPSDKKVLSMSVLRGDSAELRCFSEEYPVFNVVWWRNAKQELPEGSFIRDGILTIPSTSIEDSDLYTCSADFYKNSHLKDTVTRTMKLEIAPELELRVRNSGLIRPKGYSVNLTCVIFSPTPVKVKWMKSDESIIPDQKYQYQLLENEAASLYTKTSTKVAQLHITNISMNDYGTYVCVVENKFYMSSKEIQLFYPPFATTDDATDAPEGDDFTTEKV